MSEILSIENGFMEMKKFEKSLNEEKVIIKKFLLNKDSILIVMWRSPNFRDGKISKLKSDKKFSAGCPYFITS